jgi:hypothetical protein
MSGRLLVGALQIRVIFRALAIVEARAPASSRSGFVGVQQGLDALHMVGRLLSEVRRDVLIVDPYMDSKVFTDFGQQRQQASPSDY